jgi:hypothetical protein
LHAARSGSRSRPSRGFGTLPGSFPSPPHGPPKRT